MLSAADGFCKSVHNRLFPNQTHAFDNGFYRDSMFEGFSPGIEEDCLQERITDSACDLERRFKDDQRTVRDVSQFFKGNDDKD